MYEKLVGLKNSKSLENWMRFIVKTFIVSREKVFKFKKRLLAFIHYLELCQVF